MMIAERIQTIIHKLEVDAGARWINYLALTLLVLVLALRYDTHCYHNFSSPEAMDAAQVGRNLSEGKGFTTDFVRPFSIFLLEKHNGAFAENQTSGASVKDAGEVYGRHPDLANAPLYPVALAGLFKVTQPDWNVDVRHPFWSSGGRFMRYKPEFIIAIFNQILLLTVVLLTFLLARVILDLLAAWLSAILMLYSNELWKLSMSGLPTLLLMVIFLGIAWCLTSFDTLTRAENQQPRRQYWLMVATGLLAGLGMLTRYSFGWVIVPVLIFLALYGGIRRKEMMACALLAFAIIVTPWIAHIYKVSGTPFGTAGYAVLEDSYMFPGSRLMQSLKPDLNDAYGHIAYLILVKLAVKLPVVFADYVRRLGGDWVGILFLAGLLLRLRNIAARRLRYFTMMCLGLFAILTALGLTGLNFLSPELNTENLLTPLTPLAVIFGVAFFVTLLNQMNFPALEFRYATIILVIFLTRLQFTLALLPPQISPIAYPPYYPPDIQKFSAWIEPNELMMSDVPWAVAWYGGRQCSWTTINCQYEFVSLNDFIKPVSGLYLTLNTLDGKLLSECMQGSVDNWSNFAYKSLVYNTLPNHFPLTQFPLESFRSGLFITDHARWKTE